MADLVKIITDSGDAQGTPPLGDQELERLIIIQPTDTSFNMIPVISHWKQHGSLNTYDREKLREIIENERQSISALSDAFKRILLFESAIYIAGTYALQFPNEPQTSEWITKLNRAETALMNDGDYSEAYRVIVQAHENVRQRSHLPVNGRAQSAYLFDLKDVLNLCSPEKILPAIDVGFAGRHIYFSINEWGSHTAEMARNNDFAQFARHYSHLFKPVSGYISFKSPEIVGYAGTFLDGFESKHHTLSPSEITINGRPPLELFRMGRRQV